MEPVTWTLIVIFGLFPPMLVGYWSYKQGRKGYNEAINSRDDAMVSLNAMADRILKLEERLQTVEVVIPEKQMKIILDKIQKSIQGSWGSVIKTGTRVANKELDELAEDLAEQVPPEQKQQMMANKIQNALIAKVLDKIG